MWKSKLIKDSVILLRSLFICCLLSISIFSFPHAKAEQASSTVLESKFFRGKVNSVTLVDAANDVKSSIVVTNEQGQTVEFVVTAGIDISLPSKKIYTLKKIKPNDVVSIEYTITKLGINRALTITVDVIYSEKP